MGKIDKLKWSADTNGFDWITVNPMSGYGSTDNVLVTVRNETGYSISSTGFITFRSGSNERTVNVCRCVCNCDSVNVSPLYDESETKHIPVSGLSSGETIATFNMKLGCSNGLVSATIDGSPLTIRNSNIVLKNNIEPNTGTSAITHNVVTYFDEHECETYPMVQDAVACKCETALQNVTYATVLTGGVPQAGLPKNTVVVTYDYNESCPTVSGKITYDTGYRTINFSNGEGKLASKLPSNDDEGIRGLILTIDYEGENCVTTSFTQNGITCECNSFDFTDFIASIPQGGLETGATIFKYAAKDGYSNCSIDSLSGKLTLGNSTYTLKKENGNMVLQDVIPPNGSYDSIHGTITPKYGSETCTPHQVSQAGIGCSCNSLSSVNFITIPSGGVGADTEIGSYNIDGGCDSHFTFTSSELSIKAEGGSITTTAAIPSTTNPTGETFSVSANFDGGECRTYTVTQSGGECTCQSSNLNVEYLTVLTGGIPQTGLTAQTKVLTYSINNSCPSNIIRITLSYSNVTQELTLRNGSGYLSSAIDEAGGQRRITVNVYYDDDECTSLRGEFTQEGLSCSCESFIAPESEWAVLPYGGTIHQQNKWIVVATGDTGIYTSTGVLAGICGSLSGRSDDNYLVEDETTGEKIKTAVLPPTEEEAAAGYTQGHIYEFSACVDDIHVLDPSASGRRRVIIEFWYTPYESGGESCKGQTGFWIDDNVCDCNDTPFLTISDVPCEGTGDEIIELGRIDASEIGHSMTITAKLIGLNPIIEEFSYETDSSGNFIIKGKVPYNDGERRQIGVIMTEYTCQKGSPYQWVCNYKTPILYQAQCESCSCADEEILHLTIPNQIDFPKTEVSGSEFIASTPNKKCIDLYIVGEDEETGIYDGGWFKAYIERGNVYYELHYELVDGEHANRQATINIKSRYKETPTSPWQDCKDHSVIMHDSVCYCSAVTKSMECFMADHPNGLTVNVPTGYTYGYSEDITFCDCYDENCHASSIDESMKDCVRLCILDGDGNLTGCTSSEAYEDPDKYFTAYGGWGMYYYQQRIKVEILKDFDADKDITMVPVMLTSEGEWERCSEDTYNVHIHQESCDCDGFKDKVHITADTFVYTESYSSPVRIRRAQVYTGCGDGELYVKGADGQYYNIGAKDDPNFPDYITNMTSGCNSSYLNWFEVYVKSLTEEGQTRSTDFAIYRCTSDGVDEDCYVDFTINEEFVTDCSKKSCTNDYTLGLTRVCGSSAQNPCTIPYTGNIGNPMKIGEYNTPTGDCFTVEVDPHNPMVQNIDLRDNGSGKTEIYIECNANQTTGPSSISIDINVYHIYEQNGETVKETCSNQYQTIAVTVEAPPTE